MDNRLDHGNIILIGFMGSGKTTFGQWIAANYQMGFCDTDELIEQQQKRTIKEIFAREGEEFFRELETQTICTLRTTLSNTVISVGGGLPMREKNRELLHQLGFVVYLEASEAELVRRLQSDHTRPLLAGGNLPDKIHSLMQAREDIYKEAADMILHTDGQKFQDMYRQIVQVCGMMTDESMR